MTKNNDSPLARLKHHVTGAIERGEATAIVAVTKTMTVSELIDSDDSFHNFIDEMYWDGGYSSTRADAYIIRLARSRGVAISDPDNIDEVTYNAYQVSEKGLS